MCAWVFANASLANPERHRLFYLFYQVEIRYRQLPAK
jgi:hypothetical protein